MPDIGPSDCSFNKARIDGDNWQPTHSGDHLLRLANGYGPSELTAHYEAALRLMAEAKDLEDVVMAGRRSRGGRTELTRGLILLDLAEAHAGMPARKRSPSE